MPSFKYPKKLVTFFICTLHRMPASIKCTMPISNLSKYRVMREKQAFLQKILQTTNVVNSYWKVKK